MVVSPEEINIETGKDVPVPLISPCIEPPQTSDCLMMNEEQFGQYCASP